MGKTLPFLFNFYFLLFTSEYESNGSYPPLSQLMETMIDPVMADRLHFKWLPTMLYF
jgi:hypothetical protein